MEQACMSSGHAGLPPSTPNDAHFDAPASPDPHLAAWPADGSALRLRPSVLSARTWLARHSRSARHALCGRAPACGGWRASAWLVAARATWRWRTQQRGDLFSAWQCGKYQYALRRHELDYLLRLGSVHSRLSRLWLVAG